MLPAPFGSTVLGDDSVTTIRLTDKVLVEDTMRLGVNLGGDAYYSGVALAGSNPFAPTQCKLFQVKGLWRKRYGPFLR